MLLEKGLEECLAFLFEEAVLYDGFGVQHGTAEPFEAPFGVGSPINNAAYLCPSCGAGTHHAGLKGDKEGTVGEVFGIEEIGGCREGKHLGMGGDIVKPLGIVVGTCYDAVAANDDGPNRDFVLVKGGLGLTEGLLHVVFVGVVEDRHGGVAVTSCGSPG